MDQYLKELIEKATINGDLSEENKMFILQKANELGISEIEVNIYIEASLQEKKPKKLDFKFNLNSGEISKSKWRDNLSYLFGVGILISGIFPWIEGHASSSFGGGYSVSAGGGLGYSIPFGIGALYFTYSNKIEHLRKYYGLAITLISILLIVSYENHISSSYGGHSASAGSNAGPGVAIMLFSAILYSVINFININKIISIINSKSNNNSTELPKDFYTSLVEPLIIIFSIGIWAFYSEISYSQKEIYFILLIILSIVSIIYRLKFKINKLYLVLFFTMIIDTFLTGFNLYSKVGIDREIAYDLKMQLDNLNSGKSEPGFYFIQNFGYVIDESLVGIQMVISNLIKLAKFIAIILIAYKLIQIIEKFIEIDILSAINTKLNRYQSKLIVTILILLSLNIFGNFYIAQKNKSDYQKQITILNEKLSENKNTKNDQLDSKNSDISEEDSYQDYVEDSEVVGNTNEMVGTFIKYEWIENDNFTFKDENGETINFTDVPESCMLLGENKQKYYNKKFKIKWVVDNESYDYPINVITQIELVE